MRSLPGTVSISACLLGSLLALGCASGRVAPPREAGAGENGRLVVVQSPEAGAELVVSGRRWVAPPQRVLLHHSALWVEIANRGDGLVRFRPGDFVLRVEEDDIPAEEPRELVRAGATGSLEETRVLRTQGLRAATLAPGEQTRGFLFFRRRFSSGRLRKPVRLQVTFFDARHEAPLDRLEVPLEITR